MPLKANAAPDDLRFLTRRQFVNQCGASLGGLALVAVPGAGRVFGAAARPSTSPIHLGVSGDESLWRHVNPRLQGATTVPLTRDLASFDAVLLMAPGRVESGVIDRCLSGGKPVMLVADSWLTGDRLAAVSSAARESGTPFVLANPERFLPSRQVIREQLNSGKLGEPGLVRMHRWEPPPSDQTGPVPAWPTALLRDLDLALSFMAQAPDSIYAVQRLADERHPAAGRTVQVHLGFPGGGTAMIDYTNLLPAGDDYASLTLIGSQGAIYADDHQNAQLLYRGGHPQAVRVEENGRLLTAMTQQFVDDLLARRDLSPAVEAWRATLAVADALQRSLASRQAINPGSR